jgi:alcohol dehydrogenase
MNSTFWPSGRIVHGAGAVLRLGQLASEFGPSVAIVDEHVASGGGLDAAIAALKPLRTVYYSGREPSINGVDAVSKECEGAAVLVAIGGGSTIDITKAAAIVARGVASLEPYEGSDKLDIEPLPIIAIPTTAGTGSEVTGSCVLESADGSFKMSIRSSKLVPKIAVLDSNLLASTPRPTIAASGIDAFAHALEAYFSTRATPVTDALALGALRLIKDNLVAYQRNPSNTSAASATALGATMAGMAFTSARVGLAHAIAAVIGPVVKLPHGVCVGLALPFAARLNAAVLEKPRVRLLLDAIGGEDVETTVRGLMHDLELPQTTSAAGRTFDVTEPLMRSVLGGGRLDTNPATIDEPILKSVFAELIG